MTTKTYAALTDADRFEYHDGAFWVRARFVGFAPSPSSSSMIRLIVRRDIDDKLVTLYVKSRGHVRELPAITFCEGCESDVRPLTDKGFCHLCQTAGIANGHAVEVGRYV